MPEIVSPDIPAPLTDEQTAAATRWVLARLDPTDALTVLDMLGLLR